MGATAAALLAALGAALRAAAVCRLPAEPAALAALRCAAHLPARLARVQAGEG